jgi:hypothetical protein
MIRLAVTVLLTALCSSTPSGKTAMFQTGTTVERPSSLFALRERAGSYRYWRDRKVGVAYRAAVAAFGTPSAKGKDAPTSNLCTVRWEASGIDVGFAGPVRTCADADLQRAGWYGMRLWGSGWRTARGLRVGDPASRIRALYPKARYVSDPPRPGEWVLISKPDEDGGRVPLLVAEVGAGRVIAIDVPAGFVF